MTNDTSQIETALARLFDEEQQRVVFWNDPEREFFTTLPFVYLPEGVKILKLDEIGALEAKHTVSGLPKLLYPHEDYERDTVRRCLAYALEARRRVKEQLKKIGGMEFYEVPWGTLMLSHPWLSRSC